MIERKKLLQLLELRAEKDSLEKQIKEIENEIKDDDFFEKREDEDTGIKISKVSTKRLYLKKDVDISEVLEKYENLVETKLVVKDMKALYAVEPEYCDRKITTSIRVEWLPKSV